ncbi:MAG: rhamnulokinase [Ruminococcus sp.]|nr:rhamnulokinase [Ruminococcus sp.]
MNRRVLCFDLGASSGRAMLAEYDGSRIFLREVHRFKNRGVPVCGALYWDILALFGEIRTGLKKAAEQGGFESVGIDTWGVDYGILDSQGDLIRLPVQYRDRRTSGMVERSAEMISHERLYALTGDQIMEINTAFQLLAEKSYVLENGAALLNIPDLLGYFLTGVISSEESIASTTQLYDPAGRCWSEEAIAALGLPRRLFGKIVPAGSIKGALRPELCSELGIPQVPVAAVCGHDTQCASLAVPAQESDFIFLSSGTWSLLGTVTDEPFLSKEAMELELTNEVGYGGRINLLKNITGLWIVQETKAFLESRGEELSFADLERAARNEEEFSSFIDPDDPVFSSPGDMPERVRSYCQRTGQQIPENIGQVMRAIYLGLAKKYELALEQISKLTGKTYRRIYMVGGGTKDSYLCRLTADICGLPVTAGPVEATVMGNAAVQLLSLGAVTGADQIPGIVRRSEETREFSPRSAL